MIARILLVTLSTVVPLLALDLPTAYAGGACAG